VGNGYFDRFVLSGFTRFRVGLLFPDIVSKLIKIIKKEKEKRGRYALYEG
jgi:hypothetical protein